MSDWEVFCTGTMGHGSYVYVRVCPDCGALIRKDHVARHRRWHSGVDALEATP